jgi:hypothetical protein
MTHIKFKFNIGDTVKLQTKFYHNRTLIPNFTGEIRGLQFIKDVRSKKEKKLVFVISFRKVKYTVWIEEKYLRKI